MSDAARCRASTDVMQSQPSPHSRARVDEAAIVNRRSGGGAGAKTSETAETEGEGQRESRESVEARDVMKTTLLLLAFPSGRCVLDLAFVFREAAAAAGEAQASTRATGAEPPGKTHNGRLSRLRLPRSAAPA